MTIWMLALVLLAGGAAVGYGQGAIRVAFSLAGLVTGALVAIPLGQLIKRVFPPLGLENPMLIAVLSPFVAFLLLLILFKAVGLFVHKKISIYYKYKAGDLRQALWQRLNRRLGLCLGLVNGTIYLVLISLLIYPVSYLTTQLASGGKDPKSVSVLNRAGQDLQAAGLAKAVAAITPLPEVFYDVADIIGLIYQNPLRDGRLARYPPFLTLSERPELNGMANDEDYANMLLRKAPITEVLRNPKTQDILKNKQLLEEIWNRTLPDLKDLRTYLETDKSPKYDPEKILGRWAFDKNGSITALKRSRSNLTSSYLRFLRVVYYPLLAKTTFMATPEKQAFLRELARLRPAANPASPQGRRAPQAQPAGPATETLSLEGRWKRSDGNYELNFSEHGRSVNLEATVEGEKMVITGEAVPLVFQRE